MRSALALLAITAFLIPAGERAARAQDVRAQDVPTTGASSPGGVAVRLSSPAVREQACLSPADMREIVSEQKIVAPLAAIQAARQVAPKAEILRVNLCRQDGVLFYLITALRPAGEFVHIAVDTHSGKVAGLH